MPIVFQCPGCAKQYKVDDQMAGRQGSCPACNTRFIIPGARIATQPAAAAPLSPPPMPAPPPMPVMGPPPMPALGPPPMPEFSAGNDYGMPRRRKKSSMPLILILSSVTLLILGGGGFAVWWFIFRSSGGVSDEMKFFPDGTQVVVSIRVEEFLKSDVWKDVKKELGPVVDEGMKDIEGKTGIAYDKIEKIVAAGGGMDMMKGGQPKDVVIVVKTKEAIKAADITAAIKDHKFTETKIGKYDLQEGDKDPSFCVVDSKTVLFGKKDVLEAVLKRDKKPKLSANMEAALNKADFTQTLVVAVNVGELVPKEALAQMGGQGKGPDFRVLGKITAAIGSIKVGKDVDVSLAALCEDAKAAEDVKKLVDLLVGLGKTFLPPDMKGVAEVIDQIKFTQTGSTVSTKVTIKSSMIFDQLKNALGG